MTSPQATYRAFLLRLWHTPETPGGWRASLEDPHTGQRQAFATLAQLAEFLAKTPVPGVPVAPFERPSYFEDAALRPSLPGPADEAAG